MKIRTGFVSNSSSASFVASLTKLSEKDLQTLLAYNEKEDCDGWNIQVDQHRGLVHGYTSMDNGDLSDYLAENEVDESLFVWNGE